MLEIVHMYVFKIYKKKLNKKFITYEILNSFDKKLSSFPKCAFEKNMFLFELESENNEHCWKTITFTNTKHKNKKANHYNPSGNSSILQKLIFACNFSKFFRKEFVFFLMKFLVLLIFY